MPNPLPASLLALLLLPAVSAQRPERLTVHEWGTFTVLLNEAGEAVPGVNINEEPLPPFVHRLAENLAPDAHDLAPLLHVGTHAGFAAKGLPRSFPAARMRMETPILYVYPPASAALPLTLDVRVDFHRGWISEWYPNAACEAPGFDADDQPAAIDPRRSGSIVWKGLQVGDDDPPPETTSKVWLAPRIPAPASVRTAQGELERYLFYRGVADLRAPLRVEREADGGTLLVRSNPRDVDTRAPFRYPALWLADVRKDGRIAYRVVPGFTGEPGERTVHARLKGRFEDADYTPVGRANMRRSMAEALRAAGLFAPEAEAMLATWELSYFKTPGMRLFVVLPREWTDAVLPLTLSQPADTARVMIGRIELITPAQRRAVQRLAKVGRVSDPSWFSQSLGKLAPEAQAAAVTDLTSGAKSLADVGIEPPEDYASYLALGRFRDALILDEHRRRPTPQLAAFVKNYRLEYFRRPAGGSVR